MKGHRKQQALLAVLTALGCAATFHTRAAEAPIALAVDARDISRRILHAKLQIPASPGPLTLLYPKWIPGEHGPTGPITDMVGLKVASGGKSVEWRRVPTDMWSFTVEVPGGTATTSLDVSFDYVAPLTSWTSATAQLAVI